MAGLHTWLGFTFGRVGDLVGLGCFLALVGFCWAQLEICRFGWVGGMAGLDT